MLVRDAPAKLNLFLRVLRRRSDGYHELETVFQRIALADRLRFDNVEARGLDLRCEGLEIPCGARGENLVARAYEALRETCAERGTAWPTGGVRVTLEKRIPVGGGLGGGSSDAAAALSAFNELLELGLAAQDLSAFAAGLGADVPFFLGPPTAVGRGVGERLTPLAHPSRFWAVLAFPEFGVATGEAYGRWSPEMTREPGDLEGLLAALGNQDLEGTLRGLFNDLEVSVFALRPELGRLRAELERRADRPVRMSGSGSTLFTLANSEDEAGRIAARWSSGVRAMTAPFTATDPGETRSE